LKIACFWPVLRKRLPSVRLPPAGPAPAFLHVILDLFHTLAETFDRGAQIAAHVAQPLGSEDQDDNEQQYQ
jgi:hypothetical protein